MVKIRFIEHDGTEHLVEGEVGNSLMQTARDNLVHGIIGDCGGNCSCATCHGYVDPAWFDRLPPRSEDESVMLDLEKGTFFGLDPVGTRVWQMLAEGKAPAEIPGALAEEFDAPRERIEEDVIRLLGELLAQGLLIRD